MESQQLHLQNTDSTYFISRPRVLDKVRLVEQQIHVIVRSSDIPAAVENNSSTDESPSYYNCTTALAVQKPRRRCQAILF